jgi:hypothetical protein
VTKLYNILDGKTKQNGPPLYLEVDGRTELKWIMEK